MENFSHIMFSVLSACTKLTVRENWTKWFYVKRIQRVLAGNMSIEMQC